MNNKRILLGLLVLAIMLISIGATVAWFSVVRDGINENTIFSGAIKFHYDEKLRGLSLNDAMPMTDEQGMMQNDYFEFEVTSQTSEFIDIPYYVTVKRMEAETNMDSVIKVYLTKVDGNSEVPIDLVNGKQIAKFSELGSYTNTDGINIPLTEKLLHRDVVFAGSSSYVQKYRLRMWFKNKKLVHFTSFFYFCFMIELFVGDIYEKQNSFKGSNYESFISSIYIRRIFYRI